MYVTLIQAERERDRASLRSSQYFNLWHVRCTFFQVWRRAFESGQLSRSNVIHLQRTAVSEHQGPFGTSVSHRGWIGIWWGWLVGFRGGFLLAGYNPATGAFARGGSRQYGGRGGTVAWFINHHILSSGLVKINLGLVYHNRFSNLKVWKNHDIWIWASHALVPLITLQSHLVKVIFLSYCKYRLFSRAFKELHKYSWFLSRV